MASTVGSGPSPTVADTDIAQAVRALARVSRVLERASGELSLAHYRVLSAVASGDERASRVAQRLALGKPAISAAVDALCGRGLLQRSTDATDQRAAALVLTAQGRALLAQVENAMVERLERVCACTPNPARTVESLTWLGAALDAARPEPDSRAR
jgi:DNA-binding MarR family transcriptional regulator